MRKRPLLPLALALSTGIVCAEYSSPAPAISLFSIIAFLATIFIFHKKSFTASIFLYFAAFFCGVMLLQIQKSSVQNQSLAKIPSFTKITAFGIVMSAPNIKEDRIRFTLALRAFRADSLWQSTNGKLQVIMKKPEETLQLYEEVYTTGNLVWPLSERNPGDFNYKRYLSLQGIQALLRVRSDGHVLRTGVLQKPMLPVRKWIGSIHESVGKGLETIFDPDAAAVLRGLLLGDRSEIEPGITESFARTGVIHILAVSGLHVGFAMVFCVMIGRIIYLKERDLIVLTLCTIWVYALITGAKPPVVRASVMASLFMIGRFRDKPVDAGNLLAFAAIILLIHRPGEIFQAGFQLSFAAVAGIFFLYPKIESALKSFALIERFYCFSIGKWFLGLIVVSFTAQIATLPFSVYHFGRVSLIGVFANLAVIPAIFMVVVTSVISLLFLPLSVSFAQAIGAIPNGLLSLVLWFTDKIASITFSSLDNWYPPIWVLLLYITVVVALFYWQSTSIRFLMIAILLSILNVTVWYDIIAGGPKLQATYLNIGQGDASFVQLPSGQNILIDAGPMTPFYDAGKNDILPFLKRNGIQKINIVFVTHPHHDHIGGLPEILKEIPASKVVFADTTYKSKFFERLLDVLYARDVPIFIAKRGQIIDDFSPIKIWVAGPSPESAKQKRNLNEASLTLQIRYGKIAFLFTGDTEHEGEKRMLPFGHLLASEVLQVGHHGSRTSSTTAFLDFVRPKYAVISVGVFNRFRHPFWGVTSRLAAFGCDTYRTDLSGAQVFTSNGKTVKQAN